MKNKSRSMFHNSMNWGLIAGGVIIAYHLIMYVILGQINDKTTNYIIFLLLAVCIVYGTLQYRNKQLCGYISYGNSFLHGFLISIFAGIACAAFIYIFYGLFDPELLEKMKETAIEKARISWEQFNLTEDQIEQSEALSLKLLSPLFISISQFISTIILGIIIALFSSIFIKKTDTSFEGQLKSE